MADKSPVLVHSEIPTIQFNMFRDDPGLQCSCFYFLRDIFHFYLTVLASYRRPDLSEGLRKLHCRSLIFVGDMSPFHSEALHITSKLDRRFSALVEVRK